MRQFTDEFCQRYASLYDSGEKLEANVYLLICEIANEKGEVEFKGDAAYELMCLMNVRFSDPEEDARKTGRYSN